MEQVAELPLERLETEIVGLNAHLSAATCRWLLLVGEFDRRGAWGDWGCHSCAHYLGLTCGIDRRTAREQVRVARRLPELPLTREAFARGDLPYSKVRAITRVATPENEEALVEWARHGTTGQLERIVQGYRGALRVEELDQVNQRHARRHLRWSWDEDGALVVSARLDPEAGAVVLAALEAYEGGSAEPPLEEREPAEARRADALTAMAEAALGARRDEHPSARVPEVSVIVDLDVLADDGEGTCELAGGPTLAPETARRLACDAGVVTVLENGDGEPLQVGRRRRTPSSALRRALARRDGGCRFPDCDRRRYLHAHHIEHWARGGETTFGNVILLCSKHHRLVHEGGFTCRAGPGPGDVVFSRPDGRPVEATPVTVEPLRHGQAQADDRLGLDLAANAGQCLWDGSKLDRPLAVESLLILDGRFKI
jgi:hypothetical protein